eukprot:scaffold68136_cov55-Phaeocystis_antarctica.AAC.5
MIGLLAILWGATSFLATAAVAFLVRRTWSARGQLPFFGGHVRAIQLAVRSPQFVVLRMTTALRGDDAARWRATDQPVRHAMRMAAWNAPGWPARAMRPLWTVSALPTLWELSFPSSVAWARDPPTLTLELICDAKRGRWPPARPACAHEAAGRGARVSDARSLLFSLLFAARAAAQVLPLHFQLAPMGLLVVMLASVTLTLLFSLFFAAMVAA